MKVIFHHRFYDVYTADPAAARGRMESMVSALQGQYDFIEPALLRSFRLPLQSTPSG